MPKKDDAGFINLPGIFAAAAEGLLAQVGAGRILLDTHNIRDAGAPLEAAVRDLFSRLLPSGFRVRHGYLYDTASTCTPQIDLIISAADRSQVMLEAPDGATYSAVTDAYALAEIKSSAFGLKGHLTQFAKQIARAREMRQAVRAWESGPIPDLIPFMIVGSTTSMSMTTIRNHWAAHPKDRPDYLLLLDQGRIVMPWNIGLAEVGMQPAPKPHLPPDGLDIGVFELGDTEEARRGNALLWLYYALLHRLRASQALELEQALRWMAPGNEYWQAAPKKTAEALSSAADPFAAAMTRSFQLTLVDQIKGKKPR